MCNSNVCKCRPEILIVNRITGERFTPDCKAYSCEYCGKIKVRKLRQAILEWFKGQKLRLLTLTTTNRYNSELGKDLCEEAWKVFSKWLRKEEKVGSRVSKVQYVKLRERHLNGSVHFHLIINQFIQWKTLQPIWQQAVTEVLTKAGITGFEGAKVGNANFVGEATGASHRLIAWYVTKYVTKYSNSVKAARDSYDAGFVRFRPYAASRNVKLFTRNPSTGDWRVYHYQRCSRDQLLYLSSCSLIPQLDSDKMDKILKPWALGKLFPDLWQVDGVDFESV